MTTDNATMEVIKRKFNVQTNIKTLKKVWNLFDELGISNLILGKQVEIKPDFVINKVMQEDKINELCQTITGNFDIDFEELELSEVIEIVASFFINFSKQVQELKNITQIQTKLTKNAK